ncbi:Transcriptional regulator GlxA family, contains an amidase domain and an AraC-type DNA-binding HTH domain [Actinopolyspora lacussalsi subsp. righensis]|uniref:Transcriptional regulator GlxA family, contains an amidase domain and an AraC-type DNA-binding HTH domain n=1 Tax=Actinopolyspora righensis TaxID=995060 RepID=A0A1I7CBD5_9ACTN|nr:Transcriptional regulator GlxA family, contains an amidase domain and an AraC-type DNA-binding HTH domain [Actinopolyspora righensis]
MIYCHNRVVPHSWNVAVLVENGVAPFELGVACEVFGTDRGEQGLPTYEFALCSESPGPLRTKSGFHLIATHGLERLREADLVIVPPIDEPTPPEVPRSVIDALSEAVEAGSWVAALCSGVFVLGEAGLLGGGKAAVHWYKAADFRRRFPEIEVDESVLYTANPPIFTSAGTAAAIDLCLHLVRVRSGARTANAIARRMVVPPHREGGQAQYIELPVPTSTDTMGPVLDWMERNLRRELTVTELARKARMSPRTFARRFRTETGTTPHHWLTTRRVARAQRLLEDTDSTLEVVADSCGFGNAAALRHHFLRRLSVTPTEYRHTFRDKG